ncbi:prepilin-type N-terminal cleavage/methylation domain-containing protein [Candidatus Saccharibacteria bacterium]|nr:prepilin-type N-terminal cleavage/methylation domain-containing protein [Candidatus Saccharibacteria bacterium]
MWAKNKQHGFTIVELLIVIVVIGVLASISIVAYSGVQSKARDTVRSNDIAQVKKAIELYYVDNGSYPTVGTDNAGYALSSLSTALVPKYMAKLPVNPLVGINNYYYVRGTVVSNSFGLLVPYETKTQCHMGTNNTVGWWGLASC